ncbi:hypothetical protein BCR36DRAFT_94803 [Piromyces finnis]|uniref:protein-tyrosine-phosphatase n=1 Tax=Piromyces finnis TaxID=1754191 RepID=A0A1Y1V4M7_9FUNG|nr:hypothetical protein BCR36DRAFT_94803 [Piromyces finnis]|eukprot:ORX47270.1 hypothetical protein BCR36DRAFT_94803 [Piromyces finnis]
MSYFMKKANAKYELVLSKLGRICPSIKVENENIVQQLNSLVKKKTSIKNEVKENTSNNKAESEQQQKTDNNENEKKLQLSCRKCRKVLVSGDDIFIHEPGSGQASFSWRKRDQNLNKIGNMNVCGVYFIERQDWMEGLEEENIVSGKINCPSCKSKLGSYNWSGMQCSCGKWYSPAFSIQKKSVDEARI